MNNENLKMQNRSFDEFTSLVFADYLLPGTWDTLEVETSAEQQRTSYWMDAKLHPREPDYIDFWGGIHPEGHKIILTLVEFDESVEARHRFAVTTSRFSYAEMTTTKFQKLGDAIKHLVEQMIRTTKKFDKIHKTKTQLWDLEKIEKHKNDPNFNSKLYERSELSNS